IDVASRLCCLARGSLPTRCSTSLLPSFFLLIPPPPRSTLFPYTTLFRSYTFGYIFFMASPSTFFCRSDKEDLNLCIWNHMRTNVTPIHNDPTFFGKMLLSF